MEKLHQLPTGSWITLSQVTKIHPHTIGACEITGRPHDEHFVVVWQGSHSDVMRFDSWAAAEDYAASFGALVNSVREGPTFESRDVDMSEQDEMDEREKHIRALASLMAKYPPSQEVEDYLHASEYWLALEALTRQIEYQDVP